MGPVEGFASTLSCKIFGAASKMLSAAPWPERLGFALNPAAPQELLLHLRNDRLDLVSRVATLQLYSRKVIKPPMTAKLTYALGQEGTLALYHELPLLPSDLYQFGREIMENVQARRVTDEEGAQMIRDVFPQVASRMDLFKPFWVGRTQPFENQFEQYWQAIQGERIEEGDHSFDDDEDSCGTLIEDFAENMHKYLAEAMLTFNLPIDFSVAEAVAASQYLPAKDGSYCIGGGFSTFEGWEGTWTALFSDFDDDLMIEVLNAEANVLFPGRMLWSKLDFGH